MPRVKNIFLDYASTTPVDPRVIESITPYLNTIYANPLSMHRDGRDAESALEQSRETIAELINASPNEIFFTSSATESNNLALKGFVSKNPSKKRQHIIISNLEHPSVIETAKYLAKNPQIEVEFISSSRDGVLKLEDIRNKIKDNTVLLSAILANNEVGSISEIDKIAKFCKERGITVHTDATQAPESVKIDVSKLGVDLLTLSSHKIYGPKGVGLLYVSKNTKIAPIIHGGHQENALRAGTHNVPGVVGFAKALSILNKERDLRVSNNTILRDKLIYFVSQNIEGATLTGHKSMRLSNHASFILKGLESNDLLMLLDFEGFSCSSGSACKTGNPEPSNVLKALGYSDEEALGSLRVTVGTGTTEDDIDALTKVLPKVISKARSLREEKTR